MKKMQEFIVKGNDVFVGLEDSKRSWKVCVRSAGMMVHQTSMPAEYDNLRTYLLRRYPECKIELIYEAGFSGFWLHDLLQSDGITCVVTPPSKVTQEKVNKVKTDRIDARRLAKNLENRDFIACAVPDRERREDRQISRTLDQIQRKIISTKNQIRKFFDFHGLNRDLPAGPWGDARYKKLGELTLSPSLQICLDMYLRLLEALMSMRTELKKELTVLSRKPRYRESTSWKMSAPGVGEYTAIRLTLEWGDLSRFDTGKQLASFTGLTCREYSTGDQIHKGRITGQGTKQVRAWLIQCAWRAIRTDPVLLTKFNAIRQRSGSKKKAIVAVARKLVVRIRAVELAKQRYCLGVVE